MTDGKLPRDEGGDGRNMEDLAQSWAFLDQELENFQKICADLEKELPSVDETDGKTEDNVDPTLVEQPVKRRPPPPTAPKPSLGAKPKPPLAPKPKIPPAQAKPNNHSPIFHTNL